ncbi:MAG: SDR family NAD(P)-dependent oxidoreductase [Pseudomonadota bacterium]
MKDFKGKIAVVTGGGTGMGRELARCLVAEGCHVTICDVLVDNMEETKKLCEAEAQHGARITICQADVASESDLEALRAHVEKEHNTSQLHLLFNNAGVGGGGSITKPEERDSWERTFNICWYGVYYSCRVFMPMLLASDEAHIINTSSVNGFWASIGPQTPHSAYCAAKFAVKGFSEALITDLRLNAPHIKVSVVMPGHIGTSIAINSGKIVNGRTADEMTAEEVTALRARLARQGMPIENATDEQLKALMKQMGEQFRDNAPTTAAKASNIILDGVREERWRILVGEDAGIMDRLVREDPENAYELSFFEKLREETNWELGGQ